MVKPSHNDNCHKTIKRAILISIKLVNLCTFITYTSRANTHTHTTDIFLLQRLGHIFTARTVNINYHHKKTHTHIHTYY